MAHEDKCRSACWSIVVAVSNARQGARLAVHALDGTLVAQSDPIGQGYRWMHQIGAGPTGPDGDPEIIAVRTPDIRGIIEAYQRHADRLELVATRSGYGSYRLGSPNLDMALLAHVVADGRLDLIVPTQDMTSLALLTCRGDGFQLLDDLSLDGRLATNVAATVDADGGLVLAAGTDDGRLRIFRWVRRFRRQA